MNARLFVLFAVATLATATHAWADLAEELLQKGVELRKERRDAEALVVFRKALALQPSPRARAQVGLAEQAVGQWVAAEEDLQQALTAEDDPWIQKNGVSLRAALEVVRDHLATLRVDVTPATVASFRVNGAPKPAGKPLRVVAGVVWIDVDVDGYHPIHRSLELAPRSSTTELVTLVKAPAPKTAPEVTPPRETPSNLTLYAGIGLAGVGVSLLAGGTYFGLRTFSQRDLRDEHCVGGCDPIGLTAAREARSAATASTILFGVGVVSCASATVLILRGTRLTVSPVVGTAWNGVSLGGRF